VWRTRAVLAIAGVLAGLMLSELVVRLAGPALPTSFTSRALQELHPIYGVFHRPGASAWVRDEEFTTFVGFNRDGLRGKDVATAPRPGAARVLVVGDSFVEGAEVDEDDAMPSVLAGRLTAAGCPTESLNAGVRGWGTAQEYLYLAHEGPRFRPDVVVLVVYVGNDLVDNSLELSGSAPDGVPSRPFFTLERGDLVRAPSRPPPTPPFAPALELARAHSSLFNLAESGVAVKLGSADGAEVLRSVHRLAFAAPPTPAWEHTWAVTEALLVAARDEAEAQGARFLLAAAPHKGQLDQADWERLIRGAPLRKDVSWDPRLPQDRLRGLADAHGIQAVDLLPPLEAANGSAPLYFAENSHWTAAGHAVAAEAVAEAILGGGSCRMD
jgi:lysophospholipase L1-like esterase